MATVLSKSGGLSPQIQRRVAAQLARSLRVAFPLSD